MISIHLQTLNWGEEHNRCSRVFPRISKENDLHFYSIKRTLSILTATIFLITQRQILLAARFLARLIAQNRSVAWIISPERADVVNRRISIPRGVPTDDRLDRVARERRESERLNVRTSRSTYKAYVLVQYHHFGPSDKQKLCLVFVFCCIYDCFSLPLAFVARRFERISYAGMTCHISECLAPKLQQFP